MQAEDTPLLINLAKACDLLKREAGSHMPSGGRAQREQVIATLEAMCARPAASSPGASPYHSLLRLFAERTDIDLASGILDWMQSTHALPDIPDAMTDDAQSALQVFKQRLMAQPDVKQWMEAASDDDEALDVVGRRNVFLMRRQWLEDSCVSESLVDQLSRAGLASFRVWESAKPHSDFAGWLPYFKEVVALARRKGDALGQALGVAPYQAMLEQYNPGLRNETVKQVFAALQARLPILIQQASAKQVESAILPLPPVPKESQRRIVRRVIDAMGFDARYSRLDESAHPFSSGEWDDVRVTTRYAEDNVLSGLMGVVHEMGHLFYSRNLPRPWARQPVGAAQSMWIHESQSLFWERQIGGSLEFMEFLSPLIKQELSSDSAAWEPENLHALSTRVKPGLIRIEADEVTYPAHIILRHRLEQGLVAGTLEAENVPDAWAAEMRELLGVEVPDHAHGSMQDVHWTDGSFGYFPAYTFGALAAAQLMEQARKDLPDIGGSIRGGHFAPILGWLEERIHSQGSRYDGEELIARATGKPLSIEPWLNQIHARYGIRASGS